MYSASSLKAMMATVAANTTAAEALQAVAAAATPSTEEGQDPELTPGDLRRRAGQQLLETAPRAALPYELAPCYSYTGPGACVQPVQGPSVASAPPPSAEAVSAAVRLAEASHLDLTRHAAKEYHCVVPKELQKGKGDASRMAGGQLYETWKLHPEAAGWAQPVMGAPVLLDMKRCAGTARLSPHAALGFFSADGCFSLTFAGDYSVKVNIVISCKCSADAVQMIACVAMCIGGASTVRIDGTTHLGYYSEVRFSTYSRSALHFFACHWQKGGTKAKQMQLACLALNEARLGLGRGRGGSKVSAQERQAVMDARNVLVVAMSNGKAPTDDPVADRAFHVNLFSKFSRAEFFTWLMGFFEGDGSARQGEIRFYQSDLGFLQAVGDMLLQFGHSEPRIFEHALATDEPTYSSFQKTRTAYNSSLRAHGAAVLAKEIYDVYVLSGLASFKKAKLLYALAHAYDDKPSRPPCSPPPTRKKACT